MNNLTAKNDYKSRINTCMKTVWCNVLKYALIPVMPKFPNDEAW